MGDVTEPSVWLFDGADPARDLPPEEAEAVRKLRVTFDEPICTALPDTAVEAVRELFRGFYSHTPYRRVSEIEQVDAETIVVTGEKRPHVDDADGWEPHIHSQDIETMQSELTAFFGPLWRVRRKRENTDRSNAEPGTVVIRRVVGRRFHYPDQAERNR